MIEKREWRRIDINLTATVRSDGQRKGLKINIVNINPQGVCFVCDKEFEFGSKVELTVDLQGMGLAQLLTEVVWSGFLEKEKQYATGIRITSTDQDEREKFLRFYNLKLLYSTRHS